MQLSERMSHVASYPNAVSVNGRFRTARGRRRVQSNTCWQLGLGSVVAEIDRSMQAGAPLPQQGNKLVEQELARLTDPAGAATSAHLNGESADKVSYDTPQHPVLQSTAGMRQLSGCDSAADCMAQFLELAEKQEAIAVLNEEDCISLISAAISRGNFKLGKVWPEQALCCLLYTSDAADE